MADVFILTLKIEPELQNELNEWRRRWFPPALNYLDAHITLFHALPGARRAEWSRDLSEFADKQIKFEVTVSEPYSLGRGVAVRVNAAAIDTLHRELQGRWRAFLTPQDSQKRRAHVTLQNKVGPDEAKRALDEIRRSFGSRRTLALGICEYEYIGGPWRFEREYAFPT